MEHDLVIDADMLYENIDRHNANFISGGKFKKTAKRPVTKTRPLDEWMAEKAETPSGIMFGKQNPYLPGKG